MKKLSQNQLTGQCGELPVADRTRTMGFAFDGRNRLETGIDEFLGRSMCGARQNKNYHGLDNWHITSPAS